MFETLLKVVKQVDWVVFSIKNSDTEYKILVSFVQILSKKNALTYKNEP